MQWLLGLKKQVNTQDKEGKPSFTLLSSCFSLLPALPNVSLVLYYLDYEFIGNEVIMDRMWFILG